MVVDHWETKSELVKATYEAYKKTLEDTAALGKKDWDRPRDKL